MCLIVNSFEQGPIFSILTILAHADLLCSFSGRTDTAARMRKTSPWLIVHVFQANLHIDHSESLQLSMQSSFWFSTPMICHRLQKNAPHCKAAEAFSAADFLVPIRHKLESFFCLRLFQRLTNKKIRAKDQIEKAKCKSTTLPRHITPWS
jgi:hypothetical protein